MNETDRTGTEQVGGIDNLLLPQALISALYAEVLVTVPARNVRKNPSSPVASSEKTAAIRSMGENRRNICLLVSIPGENILPDATKEFLEKILVACRLSIDDLAIVNLGLSPAKIPDLIAQFSPKKWLVAGISPVDLGIDVAESRFNVVHWKHGDVLCLPPLSILEPDSAESRHLKRQLWGGLQKLFGI